MASLTKFSTSALCLAVYCSESLRVTAYVSAKPSSAGSNADINTAKQETKDIIYVLYTYTHLHMCTQPQSRVKHLSTTLEKALSSTTQAHRKQSFNRVVCNC